MPNPSIATAHARLGLPGPPHLMDSMAVGGIYLLMAETASARLPVLSASLAHGLGMGMSCRLLLPQHPEPLIAQLQSFGNLDINQAIRDRKLALFTVQDELCTKMARHGAEAFVKELEHFAFPDGSYLIFDQADELLALHDVTTALNQLDVLKKWAFKHRITFLLTWTHAPNAQAGTPGTLLDKFKGVVGLRTKGASLTLFFDHWQSDEAMVVARSFRLTPLGSGLYTAVSGDVVQDDTRPAHKPEQRVETPKAAAPPAEIVEEAEAKAFYPAPDLPCPTPSHRTYQVQALSANGRTQSEPPDMGLDFDSEELLFDYEDDPETLIYGKNDSPRARRAGTH